MSHRRSIRSGWQFLLIALLTIVMAAPAAAQTAPTSDELRVEADAANALFDILDHASAREFNDMYDLLHPDVRDRVPRNVAIGLFADVYGSAIASEAITTGIEVGPWTWPVNGVRYDNAAAMTVILPIVDDAGAKTWIEDTWYLVQEDGGWYWFLGTSQEFLDSINEQYANAAVDQADGSGALLPIPREQFIQSIVNDLDVFYSDVVGYTEFRYSSPRVVVVVPGGQAMSACGPASPGFLGFYCPVDATLYLEEEFLLGLVDSGRDFAAAFVIGHEWAHHVQTGLGLDRTASPDAWNELHSIELELMADCFTGAWALDAEVRGVVEPGDIQEAIDLIVYDLGDPKFIGEFDPQAHGNGEQRVRAFLNGYEQGFLGCNISI